MKKILFLFLYFFISLPVSAAENKVFITCHLDNKSEISYSWNTLSQSGEFTLKDAKGNLLDKGKVIDIGYLNPMGDDGERGHIYIFYAKAIHRGILYVIDRYEEEHSDPETEFNIYIPPLTSIEPISSEKCKPSYINKSIWLQID